MQIATMADKLLNLQLFVVLSIIFATLQYVKAVCVNGAETCAHQGTADCTAKTAYLGAFSTTVSGKTCQRWDTTSPHSHSLLGSLSAGDDGQHNYCRNPDDALGPWCYTTDPSERWEYCFPSCPSTCDYCVNGAETCAWSGTSICTAKTAYLGAFSTTVNGRSCQRWDTTSPHSHSLLGSLSAGDDGQHNYCRNPDGAAGPWCYTTDPSERWEYCFPTCLSCPLPTTAVALKNYYCHTHCYNNSNANNKSTNNKNHIIIDNYINSLNYSYSWHNNKISFQLSISNKIKNNFI